MSTLKKSLVELQDKKWAADRANLSFGDEKIRYLSVSAGGVVFADAKNNFYDLTGGGQMMFAFVLDMDRLHSELCYSLDQNVLNLPRVG